MRETTIRDALLSECGWPLRFLSPSGEIARIDGAKKQGKRVFGFKPYRRMHRLLNRSAFVPVEQILPMGCWIRFDERLIDNFEFVHLIDPIADEQFPFGEWLKTAEPRFASSRFGIPERYFEVQSDRGVWVCLNVVLTFVHDVSIRTETLD